MDVCPIPERPDEETLELITDLVPVKELVREYQFQAGGGKRRRSDDDDDDDIEYSYSQVAMSHVLATVLTLIAGGVSGVGIYYALYYTGILGYFWGAYQATELAMTGCSNPGQTVLRKGLKFMTLGFVPDCHDIHNHFNEMLDKIFYASQTLGLAGAAAGSYSTIQKKILKTIFGGSCPRETRSASRSDPLKKHRFTLSNSIASPAAGGARRSKKRKSRRRKSKRSKQSKKR